MYGNPRIYNGDGIYNGGGVNEGEFISYNEPGLPVTYRQVNYIINNNHNSTDFFKIPALVSNYDYYEFNIAVKNIIDDGYEIFSGVTSGNLRRIQAFYNPKYSNVNQRFVLDIGGVNSIALEPRKLRNTITFFNPYAYVNNVQYNCNGTVYNDIDSIFWGIPKPPQTNYIKFGNIKIVDRVTMQKKLNAIPCVDPDGLIGFFDTVSQNFTSLAQGDNDLLLVE